MSRLKPFPKPVELMEFFQDWSLPMILDFYEAERDYWGDSYMRDVYDAYNKNKGIEIIKNYLRVYPDTFESFLKRCECDIEISSAPDEAEVDRVTTFLMSNDRSDNIKKLIQALSLGFLGEWIVCPKDKSSYIHAITDNIKRGVLGKYDEWTLSYNHRGITRQEIMYSKQFEKTYHTYYFYHRLYLGYSLLIIFKAINSRNKLSLAKGKAIQKVKELLNTHNIAKEVQRLYKNQLIVKPSWNKDFTFDEKCQTKRRKAQKNFKEGQLDCFNTSVKFKDSNEKPCRKLIDRSALILEIKDICKEWNLDDKNKQSLWLYLWADLYVYLIKVGLFKENLPSGKGNPRINFSRITKYIIKDIFTDLKYDAAKHLSMTFISHRDPETGKIDLPNVKISYSNLEDDDYRFAKKTREKFIERINAFIENSDTKNQD